jgi:hypothetical protein
MPAKALIEENPNVAFIDPESLTSWDNNSQSVTQNVRVLKLALYNQITHRQDGMFAEIQNRENTSGMLSTPTTLQRKLESGEDVPAKKFADGKQKLRRASQMIFDEFDEDGDGKISRDELFKMLRTYLRQSFTVNHGAFLHMYREMDSNNDGGISLDEFHNFVMSMKKQKRKKKHKRQK